MKNVVARRRRHRSRHEISVRPDRTACKVHFLNSVANIGDRVVDGDPVSRSDECENEVIAVIRLTNGNIRPIYASAQLQDIETAVSTDEPVDRVPDDILTVSDLEHEGVVAAFA